MPPNRSASMPPIGVKDRMRLFRERLNSEASPRERLDNSSRVRDMPSDAGALAEEARHRKNVEQLGIGFTSHSSSLP